MKIRTQKQFAELPVVERARTTFEKEWGVKDTFNVSELIPIDIEEVLPGDTHECKISALIRTSTAALKPTMDNATLNIYAFYVPNRLVWENWKEFMGENKTDPWTQEIEYTIPQLIAPENGWNELTLADHFGLVPKIGGTYSVSQLPFRQYVMIFNEWFRDQNNEDPLVNKFTGTNSTGTNITNPVTDAINGGGVAIVNKFPDYFTTALPGPQKGDPVTIALLGKTPVTTMDNWTQGQLGTTKPMIMGDAITGTPTQGTFLMGVKGNVNAGETMTMGIGETPTGLTTMKPINLGVDLSGATAITIRDFRLAAATQQVLELDARAGTRYVESIEAHFGVKSDDARQQRPEFLGAIEQTLNNIEVAQTSEGTDTSPQANLSAFSKTGMKEDLFKKSFTEHGAIIYLACVRTNHTYSQGTERLWNRKTRLDFHLPITENIGEQAIYNKEIYTQGTPTDQEVFGYQEQRADYKYKPSKIKGKFRPTATDSLALWHYGDKFATLPVLSKEFIGETKENMDRTLAVESSIQPQLLADFYIENKCTRIMQPHSIPGLDKI